MLYETLHLHGSTIYLYCERLAPGLWQEPFNSISALSFLIAGGTGLTFCMRLAKGDWVRMLMACCLIFIGLASIVVHTTGKLFPITWDIAPVLLFDVLATWIIFHRGFALSIVPSMLGVAIVVLSSAMLIFLAQTFGAQVFGFGSGIVPHLGFVLWLVITGTVLIFKSHGDSGITLIAASVLLFIALWLNNQDLQVCSEFPAGVHWAWHIVNALGAYLILRGVPKKSQSKSEAVASFSL